MGLVIGAGRRAGRVKDRCVSAVSDTNREMVSDTINHEEIERFDPG